MLRVYSFAFCNVSVMMLRCPAMFVLTLFSAWVFVSGQPVFAQDLNEAINLNQQAVQLHRAGKTKDALPLMERALKIVKAAQGENSEDAAAMANNLGTMYADAGDNAGARPHLELALRVNRQRYGDGHEDTAIYANKLAGCLEALGDDGAAKPLYELALKISRTQKGEQHPETAIFLNNLAGVLTNLGDYKTARSYYEQALKIKRQTLGEENVSTAFAYNNLGYAQYLEGDFAAARPNYELALKLFKKLSGDEHYNTSMALNNMGALSNATGDKAAALAYYEQALAVRKKILGDEHVETATSLNNLAFLRYIDGDYAGARPFYEQALAVYKRTAGADSPKTTTAMNNLMLLEVPQGNWEAATKLADQTRHAVRNYVTRVLPTVEEKDQILYLERNNTRDFHSALSLALLRATADPKMPELSAGWSLNGKAVAQEALVARGIAKRDNQNIGEIAANRATWFEIDALRKALPKEAVFIDIARFRPFNFQGKRKDVRFLDARYVAWIVPTADRGNIQFVDLGPAAAIEAAVQKARQGIATADRPDSTLRKEGEVVAEKLLRDDLQKVADLVWQPLADKLGGAKRLILSPDGGLWLLPWSTLPVSKEKCLLEDFSIHYVVSGRDLLQRAATDAKTGPQIIADPDYNLDPEKTRRSIQEVFRIQNIDQVFQTRGVSMKTKLPAVDRLPNTAIEAQLVAPSIEKLAKSKPNSFTDQYALESVVKRIQRPSLLVMSTHGFFLPDQQSTAVESSIVSADVYVPALNQDGKPTENPLLRCGLLLAGCNDQQRAITGGDDGILTGKEITDIDLRGTELVVLSACETGIGEIRNGEGVAGLRQAFQLAGAKSVVASLWQVPDRDSMIIMSSFFSNMADGESKDDALRNAQLKRIEARREKFGAAHPFFWAAWTLTGE